MFAPWPLLLEGVQVACGDRQLTVSWDVPSPQPIPIDVEVLCGPQAQQVRALSGPGELQLHGLEPDTQSPPGPPQQCSCILS